MRQRQVSYHGHASHRHKLYTLLLGHQDPRQEENEGRMTLKRDRIISRGGLRETPRRVGSGLVNEPDNMSSEILDREVHIHNIGIDTHAQNHPIKRMFPGSIGAMVWVNMGCAQRVAPSPWTTSPVAGSGSLSRTINKPLSREIRPEYFLCCGSASIGILGPSCQKHRSLPSLKGVQQAAVQLHDHLFAIGSTSAHEKPQS